MGSEYIQEVNHYQIHITSGELSQWEEKIQASQSLAPEIVGYLLGRSVPVFRNVKCELCGKEIRKGEEVDWDKLPWEMRLRTVGKYAHQSCYDEHKKGGVQL